MKILIIDDSLYGMILKYQLKRSEHVNIIVSYAQSLKTAMHKFENDDFDLVVSDYMLMPSNQSQKLYDSGLEFYKYLRNKNNSIPFVLFTEFNIDINDYPALKNDLNFYYLKKSETNFDKWVQFLEKHLFK